MAAFCSASRAFVRHNIFVRETDGWKECSVADPKSHTMIIERPRAVELSAVYMQEPSDPTIAADLCFPDTRANMAHSSVEDDCECPELLFLFP